MHASSLVYVQCYMLWKYKKNKKHGVSLRRRAFTRNVSPRFPYRQYTNLLYRKPPNISPGLIFGGLIFGGLRYFDCINTTVVHTGCYSAPDGIRNTF